MASISEMARQVRQSGAVSTASEGRRTIAEMAREIRQGTQAGVSGTPAVAATSALSAERDDEGENNGGFLGGLGYLGEKIGLGALSFFEGIWDFTAGGIAETVGADDWAEKQIANDWVNYNHADEWFNPGDGWKVAGDVAQGIGNSVPSLVIHGIAAVATGGLSLGASAFLTFATSGLSAAGQNVKEAYRETGKLGGKEWLYGTAAGAMEGAIEAFSDDVLGWGTGTVKKAFGKDMVSSLTRDGLGKTLVKSFGGEALEEAVSTYFTPHIKRITYDKDAEGASARDILYAATIGGLSGMLMGGTGKVINSTVSTVRGANIAKKGNAEGLISAAREVLTAAEQGEVEADAFTYLKQALEAVEKSRGAESGPSRAAEGSVGFDTFAQKKALGELEQAVTVAGYQPFLFNEASRIVQNPEVFAESVNRYFSNMDTGEKISVSAEELTAGIDFSSKRSFRKSLPKALQTNEKLRTLTVLQTANRLSMDTESYAAAFGQGTMAEEMINDQNLNHFIAGATQAQKNAVGTALGVADWDTATAREVNEKYREFLKRGGAEQAVAQKKAREALLAIDEGKANGKVPASIRLQKDGARRYIEGGVDVGIYKDGDGYYVHDYTDGVSSKRLDRAGAQAFLNNVKKVAAERAMGVSSVRENGQNVSENAQSVSEKNSENVAERSALHQNEAKNAAEEAENTAKTQAEGKSESEEKRSTGDIAIDVWAKEHVPHYKELSGSARQTVRATIRQARAHGFSEAEVKTFASVAAHSGLRIVFDTVSADQGDALYDGSNTIYIDPNAPVERRCERLLLHEGWHAVFVKRIKKSAKLFRKALKQADPDLAKQITDQYTERYEERKTPKEIYAPVIDEEIVAGHIEEILGHEGVWEYILAEDPKTADGWLDYFRRSAREYSTLHELPAEARRLARKYKKMFEAFSAQNRSNNAAAAPKVGALRDEEILKERHRLNERLGEQLQDWLENGGKKGKKYNGVYFDLGTTPDILVKHGAKSVRMVMYDDVVAKATGMKDDSAHMIALSEIAKLPSQLNDPILLFKGSVPKSFVALTEITDKQGNDVIVAVHIKDGSENRSKITKIASLYSKTNEYGENRIISFVENQINSGNLLDASAKKAPTWFTTRGLQLPKAVQTIIDANNSIAQNPEKSTLLGQEISGNSKKDGGERFALPLDGRKQQTSVNLDSEGKQSAAAQKSTAAQKSAAVRKSGDVVTISRGELAKLHANYAGDKMFAKKSVSDALASIEAFRKLPAEMRNDFVNRIWTGYNQRLHQQGFDLFTDTMWHQLHATIMQEVGFDELGNMTEEAYAEAERTMDEQIVAALHKIVDSGKPTIKARLESDTSTEGYRKQAEYWRGEHSRTVERNKLLGRVKYVAERLDNAKTGRYVSAANYRGDTFRVAVRELAAINWRGGLVRDAKIREHFAKLAAWYTKDNPLYKGDGDGNELFRREIKEALDSLGNAENGILTNDDLLAAETVLKYFAHENEAHNTVYKNGKRVDALPLAKEHVAKIGRAAEISGRGFFTRSSFARLTAEPALLMRQADGYQDGFFTEQFEALRQGTIDAAVKERRLAEEFEKFWGEHKAYGNRYNNATVTFDGKEMPLQEAISLYMTMKREQAFAGLAGAGFEIDGKKAKQNISDGFADAVEKHRRNAYNELPPEVLLTLTKEGHTRIEQIALEKAMAEKREALEKQFSAEDKALIAIMEKTMEQCRDVKVEIDEIVQGYSNVTGGYYFPIKRAGLAESVDAFTGFEGDRVSNLSINKDTVKNAHKLYIEPAHVVFMRHVKAVSLYHGLGVFTDNFNRLYNLNVNSATNEKAAQSAAAQAYAKAEVNSEIVELVQKVKKGEHKHNDAVDLGTVSHEVAEKIKAVTGQDFTGYKIAVEARQIEHILKRHGENGSADHSMAKDDDIAKMLFVAFSPEHVSDGGTTRAYVYTENGRMHPAKTVICERAIGEKSYYTIHTAVDTKKKTLHIVSAFIGESGYKRGAPQTLDANTPEVTPKSGNAGTPVNSIPQNGENVKFEDQKNIPPLTIRDALGRSNAYTKEMLTYFKELKQDVEGISKKRGSERFYNDAVAYIRSAYATYQLGANPKVWVTQLSSLVAASNMLDVDALAHASFASGKDVDTYCPLAWLRNNDNAAAMAQAVSTPKNAVQRAGRGTLQRVRDASTWMIGRMDRLVVEKLFAACQVQVQKDGGPKLGTEENKVAAGKMLTRVILETQQNSLATERSAAMRSGDELLKGSTMFSADAMKNTARVVEADGRIRALHYFYKEAKKTGNNAEAAHLEKQIKAAKRQRSRSLTAFVGVALFNAALAYGFKWLYRRDEEEDAGTFVADTVGNMLGGIPFVRDAWGFFQDGYEADHFLYATFNDVLGTVSASYKLLQDAANGKEITRQQTLAHMRKVLYATGQLTGLPVRNVYNVTTGIINRISPNTGYKVDSLFYQKNYRTDLAKALEEGDDDMAAFLLDLAMEDESYGGTTRAVKDELLGLLAGGYSVLPRSMPKEYTLDGETVELSEEQQSAVAQYYADIPATLDALFVRKEYKGLSQKEREAAIGYVYDIYRATALTQATGHDFCSGVMRVSSVLGVETVALAQTVTRGLESDLDQNGKAISGSKRKKVVAAIAALDIPREQKLLLMVAKGYSLQNGDFGVMNVATAKRQLLKYILSLKVTKQEKEELAELCGFTVKNGKVVASSVA